MQDICNDLYIQEVKAAESLVLDIDMWECPTNSETALSMQLAVSTDISTLVVIHPTAVMSFACQPITEQAAKQ
jgi:hypothetical protein